MTPAPDHIRLMHDGPSGVEAIEARFAAHAYDLHRHDDWLVGVTEQGVQDFHCRGAHRRSTPGRVILIEPGEAHDGQAGAAGGFAYRMLYLPQAWLRAALADAPGGDPGFAATLCDDPALGGAIRAACLALAQPEERLGRDLALDAVLGWLRPHLGRPSRGGAAGRNTRLARRARERLEDDPASDPGADGLARAAGAADRFQLARAFRAAYGTSPHAYLVQVRLLRARRLLAEGLRPALVAAECGFADQSHLGRRFRRAYGLTPAAYRALCTGVPDRGPGMA
ncbi:AraC family transcriptional regulator [Belnapia sp. T6]|uniref:AraC family transcriptional regulator n=1 Tax=Belnapia mucosa TaxID=2804532 RepID=A0ABS1V1X6_9PROT|nr:AraC family transcriptional regulator [Belnapia mucosa]MBL6455700.1 AraC family transcriptional regulator [Belnapia mucosa]